ncbi:hypothetical protein [uncultured Pseudomonas sp.]|uniref:hypothetical protein n=1 Tax=uncultured Pseudomonas sp. TaxID=114707 RepID=UPI0025D8A2AF|nr:hypothetical protein [uncultured Pseudomonas sp.]
MCWPEILKFAQLVSQWGSVLLAILAAWFWWRSAVVETPDPNRLGITVVKPLGPAPMVAGASFVGVGQSEHLKRLMLALARQSKLSGVAARYAAAAAIAQGIALLPLSGT